MEDSRMRSNTYLAQRVTTAHHRESMMEKLEPINRVRNGIFDSFYEAQKIIFEYVVHVWRIHVFEKQMLPIPCLPIFWVCFIPLFYRAIRQADAENEAALTE